MTKTVLALAFGASVGVSALWPSKQTRADVYGPCITSGWACKLWYGTATTTSTGAWSVSFPAGTFTTTPVVHPTALSADTTLANSAYASLTAQSATGASGMVTLPNTIAVGGAPNKAAGAGITVDVVAVGY